MAKSGALRRNLKAGAYGIAAGAVAALVLHGLKSAPAPVVAHESRTAMVVTPEGGGNCRRLTVSNDAPVLIEARTLPCAVIRTRGADLPPVLQGYQDWLRE